MRRLLIAFEPPDGGVGENVLQLAGGLAERGFAVELAGPREAAIYPRLPAGLPAPHRLPLERGYGRPAADAAAFAGLWRLLRAGHHDLVHCHSAKAGVLGRLAARASGVPAVYSPHCFPFIGDLGEARRRFATATERALAPLSAGIVCVCREEREQGIRAGLDPARLHVVANACAPPPAVEPDPTLTALRAQGPVAAAVAVLREQKRLDVFLDAVPHVWERLPQARLALVGDGPLYEPLRAQARALGLLDDPRFAWLPFRAPAARYLRAIDVFVLPSAWEALPIAVLEALSCGVPQVATAVGGTPEAVVPETGVLVPPGDPAAMGAAIAGLLADAPRRRAMAAAATARWSAEYRIERMVAETAAVYERVLGATRASATSPAR